jgi:hypothetical protein
MNSALAQLAAWLSAGATALGQFVLAPLGALPGWASATAIAAVTGVLLLVVFKFTSNQKAIQRVRNDINAHLLSLRLFKDNVGVSLRAQGRILRGAFWLFVLAIVPMVVMALPVTLLLGQLSLWYQARPLHVGEEAVVTLKLNGSEPASPAPTVSLEPTSAVEVTVGPVHVKSKREVCWNVQARERGNHRLIFQVGGEPTAKELAIGDGVMRVSPLRPGWDWEDILLNPAEPPFRATSAVRSIEIAYPPRAGWVSGTDWWVVYWFAVSMVAALLFRRALNVAV